MARYLDVFLGGDLVGQLEQDDYGALWFQYDTAWLGSSRRHPISASLPLREERYKRNDCRPFFAGLLPEETSRKLVAQTFGVSERNDFALLEKIGAECAGAVSLLPQGEVPITGRLSYREITEAELAEKLAAVPRNPLMAGEDGIRLSLAGAQGKIAVMIRDGRYFLPLEGSPSTHILKPENTHFVGLVDNEHFCMKLAAEVGLDVAQVEVGLTEGQKYLQIARYDRQITGDGILQRIHQEDFCQAMGIPPEMKYQQEGGPNLKQCFELVRAQSVAPGPDILKLFDAVVFNYLIGNCDAHGKNFSLLYGDAGCRFAPLYDLVCTRAYPEVSTSMAMKIGNQKEFSLVAPKHWDEFISEAGFGRNPAIRRMKELADSVKIATNRFDENALAELVTENCEELLSFK